MHNYNSVVEAIRLDLSSSSFPDVRLLAGMGTNKWYPLSMVICPLVVHCSSQCRVSPRDAMTSSILSIEHSLGLSLVLLPLNVARWALCLDSINCILTTCPNHHSFIHSVDLYSASPRDYYRGAPSPVTDKEGFQRDVKFGRNRRRDRRRDRSSNERSIPCWVFIEWLCLTELFEHRMVVLQSLESHSLHRLEFLNQ